MKKEFSRVLLKNQSDEILILKDRPDTWNFPGGKQELGESALECAIREMKEELAVEITELEEIFTGPLVFDSIVWQGHFYFAKQAQGKVTQNEPNKIKGVQFIKRYEEVNFSPGLAPLFDYLARSDYLKLNKTNWK